MLNVLVIVWRESLEAMLVIGVLLSWIARQEQPRPLRHGLWLGACAGVALAMLIGLATYAAQGRFAGQSLDVFQLAMVLIASALIVQMVWWMHRHGMTMKRELEASAGRAAGALGIGAITALAVAREGGETVVFLYGLAAEVGGDSLGLLIVAAIAGFVLAAATSWIVARGAGFLNYRTLFRVSEILLLLIAHALLANGVDRMIALDWLDPLIDPVWDISAVLDDGRGAGRLLADFTGFRSRPAGVLLGASLVFWALMIWRLLRLDSHAFRRARGTV